MYLDKGGSCIKVKEERTTVEEITLGEVVKYGQYDYRFQPSDGMHDLTAEDLDTLSDLVRDITAESRRTE